MELAGVWRLERSVRDGDRTGDVTGRMTISPGPRGLRWYESGELSIGGRTAPVTRETYLVDLHGEPWMAFADGRPFHPWRPGEAVEHPCGEDLYVGRVDVDSDLIRTTWRVTGPDKDQLLLTSLHRMPSESG